MDRVSPVTLVQNGKDKVYINYNSKIHRVSPVRLEKEKKEKDFIIYKFINL